MRRHWIALLLLGGALALHAAIKPTHADNPGQPIWIDPPIADYKIPEVAPLPTVSLRPKMEHSLATCCGNARASLGPLFGTITIGPASMAVLEGDDPRLYFGTTGLVIHTYGGEGEHGMYLDRIEIDIPDDDLCIDLEIRLQHLWGPGDEWSNAHQRASLRRAGLRDPVTAVCTLSFDRVTSPNPHHCADDETPVFAREVDMKRHVVERERAISCELSRDRPHLRDRYVCSVDKQNRYWLALDPVGVRECTDEEASRIELSWWNENAQFPGYPYESVLWNP